jgi:arylsulfatase A-like enzyme
MANALPTNRCRLSVARGHRTQQVDVRPAHAHLHTYKEEPPPHHPKAMETLDDARLMIDGVDGSLAYVDWWVGKIVELLDEKGVLEDTAIIVSGDHGDSFGEHGQYGEHGIANVAVHNVPLVIRWPGMAARGRNDALLYNLDLCPTLCDLLNIRTPSEWDGMSFAAALRGEPFDGRPYLVYDHATFTVTRAVRTKDWTLIAMYHPGLYPYYSPFYLHDLATDPYQQENLYPERQDKFGELCGYLQEWRLEQLREGGAPDPQADCGGAVRVLLAEDVTNALAGLMTGGRLASLVSIEITVKRGACSVLVAHCRRHHWHILRRVHYIIPDANVGDFSHANYNV